MVAQWYYIMESKEVKVTRTTTGHWYSDSAGH